mmetsp:Transcript_55630/g.148380  ORF Transcript_55630/g.148380 Transcript_55630/m.148380 type:complete len:82 (+) Transcript_55630:1427-1672(+)
MSELRTIQDKPCVRPDEMTHANALELCPLPKAARLEEGFFSCSFAAKCASGALLLTWTWRSGFAQFPTLLSPLLPVQFSPV